jgi:hypothetical protein
MQIVNDFIELDIVARDITKQTSFKVAFKLLSPKTARHVLKRIYNYNYEAQCAVLLSNIVYIDQLSDSKGNLTNSFEQSIIKDVLQGMPYFESILGNFVALLQNMELVQRKALQEQNLFNVGKWQYEVDYGKQDLDSKIAKETEELQDSLGEFMNFEDEIEKVRQIDEKKELLATRLQLPNLLWNSNVPFLKIFNIAKLHQNEWGILNPVVLVELAKELELRLSDVLTFIPIIKAGYESMKPKETTT